MGFDKGLIRRLGVLIAKLQNKPTYMRGAKKKNHFAPFRICIRYSTKKHKLATLECPGLAAGWLKPALK